MTWKNWGDHPVVVTIAVIASLVTVVGFGYFVYDRHYSLPQSPSPQTPRNLPVSSPERSLNSYTQSLTNRDFPELTRIYPKANQEQWLKGTSGKAPILTVQVVGQSQRIMTSADGMEIVLRATLQYCREDGSGSTDIKNYIFFKNQEIWQLDSMTAPEKVTPIRC